MQPVLFGFPITELFLYFVIYSFLGWAMETVYCSVGEHRLVARGFLFGPICPIYGVGVLLMLIFLRPFAQNLWVFYGVATVVMSAWEYLVAWFLETTTHIKYWDYSMYRFNIKGRICLWVSLMWGILSYVAIFLIHPPIARLVTALPDWVRYTVTGIFFALLVVDTITTIRKLALTTKLMTKLEAMGQELQLQMALGKAELGDRFETAKDGISDRLTAARSTLADAVPDGVSDSAEKLKARYNDLLSAAERHSRRFRNRYSDMSSKSFAGRLEDVKAAGSELNAKLQATRAQRKKDKNK